MIKATDPLPSTLGFHHPLISHLSDAHFRNALVIMGWTPYLGSAIGIFRVLGTLHILQDSNNSYEAKKFLSGMLLRGIVEIYSGDLLIAPDLVVTCWRVYQASCCA